MYTELPMIRPVEVLVPSSVVMLGTVVARPAMSVG
jgi:hypothetical protein